MAKRLKRKNVAAKAKKLVLSKTMQEALVHFLEHHPANRISKNLRRMLVEYLMQNVDGQPIYLCETLMDLHGLFELLDVAEEQWHFKPRI